ncbi:MAG: GTP 3',8-cyclase MoaA [Caldilinea sp.]|nr:GTP 3',8-cyclase MoaA [Caldilinea sp.]MCB0056096.1 GTP 3',8-cyclase MoaA [Caldilineaceae bacterium]MCB9122237.1 GTP 3',8-cyclase MoaA [Caldilineaceae bacterium]MCB9124252.1 GTP 3',8-cyclase MoaA [Caldilineaceae bacterium]MCO5210281.1 GTP 3',8-cyclase MoaA [Caldilinea sp.]
MISNVSLYTTTHGSVTVAPLPEGFPIEPTFDSYGRRINYLRISLTDACNLRCVYCMPEDMHFRPRNELMSDDELLHLVKIAASLGVTKIRLTGGEPTIRPGIVDLVRAIAATPGIKDLAMTTNGILLDKLARPLAEAGLKRVNISIDTLDADKFHRITRWGHLDDVWRGIRAAEAHGLLPIKLNSVVVRNFNDAQDMIDLAQLTVENDWEVRFIEMMPFGEIGDFQQTNVVTYAEMKERIEAHFGPLEEVGYDYVDPSRPFRINGALGTVGFISSVTEPFCQGCGRVRLTADGKLRLCLLRDDEVDLLTSLRAGASWDELRGLMRDGAYHKPWGHDLAAGHFAENRAMNQLGG